MALRGTPGLVSTRGRAAGGGGTPRHRGSRADGDSIDKVPGQPSSGGHPVGWSAAQLREQRPPQRAKRGSGSSMARLRGLPCLPIDPQMPPSVPPEFAPDLSVSVTSRSSAAPTAPCQAEDGPGPLLSEFNSDLAVDPGSASKIALRKTPPKCDMLGSCLTM